MTNEMKVLREFVKEFSPVHQMRTDEMSYYELFVVVEQVVGSHKDLDIGDENGEIK